ncbi:MAG TPA: hypothetical protein PKO09_15435 [Anaerolineae bacterium]|nr:hypothetical protein [Anaerolineae bacterium]
MRTRRRGSTILAGVAVVAVLLAVIATIAFLALRRDQKASTGWQDPLSLVVSEEVVPGLALYPLAGAAEVETIDAGIDNGELASAYASLVYAQELSDTQRIGRLTALAAKLTEEDPAVASNALQQAADVALLSPDLNDPQRADALWRVARGWGAMEQTGRALQALEQAQLLATDSPYLQAAQRRWILAQLEEAYRSLGADTRAESVRSLVVELDQGSGGRPDQNRTEAADLPRNGQSLSSPEVGALEEARRQAAYAVIESLSQGGEPPLDLIAGLENALRAEDAAKLSLYNQELAATTQAGRRSEIHHQLVHWLLLKCRVAQKAFGLSIVPEWESRLNDLIAELSKAQEDLAFDYEDWSASLPYADQIAPSSYAALRSTVLAGRLGVYPNYPAEQLVEKLSGAVDRLLGSGLAGDLYVGTREEDGEVQFFLTRSGDRGLAP